MKYSRCLAGFFLIMLCGLAIAQDKARENKTVLIWGDSLSAAYGMDVQRGWVALLREKLNGHNIEIVNGSISGETTQGGLARLPDALDIHEPSLVVLELGANDGLRGLPVKRMRDNLQQMIDMSREAGAEVLLLGMHIPPNFGPVYARQFSKAFEDLAVENGVAHVPFFLDGVSENARLMQYDNLHPNEKAQSIILGNIWPSLEPLIAELF